MLTVSEQEWKAIPRNEKRITPLTKLKQYRVDDEGKQVWLTETINFTIGGNDA